MLAEESFCPLFIYKLNDNVSIGTLQVSVITRDKFEQRF